MELLILESIKEILDLALYDIENNIILSLILQIILLMMCVQVRSVPKQAILGSL